LKARRNVGFFFYINDLGAIWKGAFGSAWERKTVKNQEYYDTLRQSDLSAIFWILEK
jgi:hypothetical protein